MGGYLIGIDAGNTLIKAVLFDCKGNAVASEYRDSGTHHPHPGHVERDIAGMRDCTAAAIRGCVEKAGVSSSEILAVGCSGHGNGIYVLGPAGEPLLGIPSLDSRASNLVDEWKTEGRDGRLSELCRQKPWPSQTATLLAWLMRNRPELMAEAGRVMFCKDVIVHFLTGHIGTDYSDASGGALLALPSRDYDDALLIELGIPEARHLLPPLAEPTDIVGHLTSRAAELTGLAVGTPVVAGLFDVVASALGSGVARPGTASIVAGTWSINQLVTDEALFHPDVFIASSFRPDRYMQIEASPTSATNFEWFLREFMADSLAKAGKAATLDMCNQLVAGLMPSHDHPLYHPYLYGSNTDSNARAGYFGVGGWHTQAHMIHAVMEGVVFGHRDHVEALRRTGATIQSAMLSGGAARSRVWAQMFADVLQIEIITSEATEAGALGAAMAAGIGVGVFRDFEAASSTVEVKERFYPNREHVAVLDDRYDLFGRLGELMHDPWKRFKHAD